MALIHHLSEINAFAVTEGTERDAGPLIQATRKSASGHYAQLMDERGVGDKPPRGGRLERRSQERQAQESLSRPMYDIRLGAVPYAISFTAMAVAVGLNVAVGVEDLAWADLVIFPIQFYFGAWILRIGIDTVRGFRQGRRERRLAEGSAE